MADRGENDKDLQKSLGLSAFCRSRVGGLCPPKQATVRRCVGGNPSQGFSLIELVIVILILGIIAGIGSRILQAAFTSYLTNHYISTANQEARLAFERMTRDFRAINSPGSITTATSSQLTFTNMNGTTITYQLSGTNLTRNSQILASGISSLTFGYLNQNGATTSTLSAIRYVTVTLNMTQNNVSYSLRTTIFPLNFE